MKTVLCFGDSNTHGTKALRSLQDRGRFPKGQRWPDVMAAELGEAYEVIAEGHPSRTSALDDPIDGEHKNGRRILPALLESHRPVDLLIVLLGTNDLKARFNLSAGEIASALEKLAIVNRTYGLGRDGGPPKLLYVSPVPILETGLLAEMFAGGAAKSKALAGHLQAVATVQGAGFFDLAPVGEIDPVDGIHWTAAGQDAVGRALAVETRKMLEGPG